MSTITALLYAKNDALRLGRCLETLYPCDEVVIVDLGSEDDTRQVAADYGARVVAAGSRDPRPASLLSAVRGWILCLDPHESLSENLAASLYELKCEWDSPRAGAFSAPAFSVFLREETENGWVENPAAQTRLVPAHWARWQGRLPLSHPSAVTLEGELLRFVFP